MQSTYILEYINSKKEESIVELDIDYSTSYDGIGYYEYGSEKCFDKGQLTLDIDKITYNKTNLSNEDLSIIESEIDKNNEDITNNCLADYKSEMDSAKESEYDRWAESQI